MTTFATDEPGVVDEESGILRVPLPHLLATCHPGQGDPWGIGVVTLEDLRDDSGVCTHVAPETEHSCRATHLNRIRVLATTGWPDPASDPHSIMIDVGLGDYIPEWPLVDGNHRVLAAWLRGDALIEVQVAGDWDRALDLLLLGDDTAWDR